MKNFRKVLALILVVATLFSFVAMTSAREVGDYTDNDKISYTEAVDVLTAIGILDGYTDGSFKPTDTIAREEMAKMVAVLSNAGDDVSSLYASACKFADTKDRWSASYVAYCNETGIVAGRNASTFDPRGKVTGIETAKMLLCLIGFDATAQGYVGTNWKVNVQRDAKNVGLLSGFAADYDMAKAITREEAAQMMLNALKAPMVVGTVSNNIVTVTNNVWVDLMGVNGVSLKGMTLTDAANKYGCWVLYGNVVVSDISVWKNYKGLEVNYEGYDCYHNPSVVWTYTNSKGTVTKIGTYPVAPNYSYTSTATLATDLKEEIDSTKYYDVLLYEDGKYVDTYTLDAANMKTIASRDTGNGVLTNVYVDDYNRTSSDGKTVYGRVLITLKNTYIGKVTYVDPVKGTFTLNADVANEKNTFGFAKDDMVLYWLCGTNASDLHDAKVVTPVTGVCTRTEVAASDVKNSSKVTVDGKVYGYDFNLGNSYADGRTQNVMASAQNQSDSKYDLYLDEYGYIMYWAPHVDAHDYVYAYGVEDTGFETYVGQNNQGRVYKYTNDLVTFDEKYTEDVVVDEAAWTAIDSLGDRTGYNKGLLFSYELVNGVAKLHEVAERPGTAYLTKTGDVVLGSTGAKTIYGTNATQYMVRTWNYTKGEYEYNVYTAKELPAALEGYKFNGASKMATLQYFSTDINGVEHLDCVFIDALYQKTSQRAFVYAGYEYTISDALFDNQLLNGTYKTYKAVINGENAILALTDTTLPTTIPYLYTAKLQVVGLVDGTTPVYANVTSEPVTTNDIAHKLSFELGKVIVKDAGNASNVNASYWLADDAFAVVYDGTNATKLDGVEKINNYFVSNSVATYEGWVVTNAAGEAAEIYINVTIS